MSDGKAPVVIVDQSEFNAAMKKLDKIEEKVEFVGSEIAQRIGKKVGRGTLEFYTEELLACYSS